MRTVPTCCWCGRPRIPMLSGGECCTCPVFVARPGEDERAAAVEVIGHDPGDGVALIAAERRRQVESEGWTGEHDREHRRGELRLAARAYASDPDPETPAPAYWPFEDGAWKPSDDPIRNLVKAGALIAAEIDRLQGLDSKGGDADAG